MKIFITGATGFIGRNLVRKFAEKGHQISVNLYGEEESPFDDKVMTYRLNEDNIFLDTEYLKREAFDGVIHLASLYLTCHNPEDVIRLIDSNLRFSSYILECAVQAKIKIFINTGTFWQNYNNEDFSPVNLYAATKQAFESIAQYYIKTNQIKFCTLRLSDTYGPNDSRPKIFNIWNNIAKNGETLNMSPGNQIIDISYVDDIVDAYLILLSQLVSERKKIKNGSIFAVRAQKRYTLKELAKIFEEVTNQRLNINWGGRPYRHREVMMPWENGIVVPGWKPKIDIKQGIRLTLEFNKE